MAGIQTDRMLPMSGKSLVPILESKKSGIVDTSRKYVFAGRERHSSSRWNNAGYPQRAVRSREYLLIWNAEPERWPAGAPQSINPDTKKLNPMYGIDRNGNHHSEWAFTDIDASPSKSFIVENHANPEYKFYFDLAVAKRPEFELFKVTEDPGCLKNLSGQAAFSDVELELKKVLFDELEKTGDPRVVGPDKEIFDSYIRYSPMREFPRPDWAK